jgi:uncharacterized protein (DUF1778 family)
MTSRSGSENRRRNIVLHIRVDETEKRLIDRAAKSQGVSIPELLRRSAFRSIAASQKSTPRK